jgi:hypothetical protein
MSCLQIMKYSECQNKHLLFSVDEDMSISAKLSKNDLL